MIPERYALADVIREDLEDGDEKSRRPIVGFNFSRPPAQLVAHDDDEDDGDEDEDEPDASP